MHTIENVKNELSKIVGSDFKVRIESPKLDIETQGGDLHVIRESLKVNVPSLDVTQLGELYGLYENIIPVHNIEIKRSGPGLVIIIHFR